jgi:hypothetical protein
MVAEGREEILAAIKKVGIIKGGQYARETSI